MMCSLASPSANGPAAPDGVAIGPFSSAQPGGELPAGWRELTLSNVPNRTRYSLVEDEGLTVLRAEAEASSSGLSHAVHLDPRQYPLLTWRWKVGGVVKSGNVFTKAGDDYPARLYVFFDYDINRLSFAQRTKLRMARLIYGDDLPIAGLCYVWDNKAPIGTSVWNAYTNRLRMVVLESGEARTNQWITERRNVYEDFKAAFGEEPPDISGVAIAADTDNTRESTLAHFGDLLFSGADQR